MNEDHVTLDNLFIVICHFPPAYLLALPIGKRLHFLIDVAYENKKGEINFIVVNGQILKK